jgi:hypothetical protein
MLNISVEASNHIKEGYYKMYKDALGVLQESTTIENSCRKREKKTERFISAFVA